MSPLNPPSLSPCHPPAAALVDGARLRGGGGGGPVAPRELGRGLCVAHQRHRREPQRRSAVRCRVSRSLPVSHGNAIGHMRNAGANKSNKLRHDAQLITFLYTINLIIRQMGKHFNNL